MIQGCVEFSLCCIVPALWGFFQPIFSSPFPSCSSFFSRELKQWWQPWQWEQQKSSRLRLAKQQLCTCIMLFRTFLSRHCMTATWKCLISHFVEDMNTRQQLSYSFPELWYSPLEFNSKTKWPTFDELNIRWNKGNKVWGSIHSFLSHVFVTAAIVHWCLSYLVIFFQCGGCLFFCVLFFLGGGSLLGTFITAVGALFNLGAGYQKWNSLWILQAPI